MALARAANSVASSAPVPALLCSRQNYMYLPTITGALPVERCDVRNLLAKSSKRWNGAEQSFAFWFRACYSALMPSPLMSFVIFARPSRVMVPNCTGVELPASIPSPSSRSRTEGSPAALTVSAFSRSMTGLGVPCGA